MTGEQRNQINAIVDSIIPPTGRIVYYMAFDGSLWSGPRYGLDSSNPFCYARFAGFDNGQPIWNLERTHQDEDWMWIPDDMADVYIDKIKTGAWKLPTYEKGD